MFDIGFWEIAVIAVVALLVVGPEQLPGLLRTAGSWAGKAKRLINEAKTELDLEVNRAEEIKKRIAEEARVAEMHRAINAGKDKLAEVITPPSGTAPVSGAMQGQAEQKTVGPEEKDERSG